MINNKKYLEIQYEVITIVGTICTNYINYLILNIIQIIQITKY